MSTKNRTVFLWPDGKWRYDIPEGSPVAFVTKNLAMQQTIEGEPVKMVVAAKNDQDKIDLSLIPYISNIEHAKAFMVGEKKYGRYNYCKGHKASQLVAAMQRHMNAWFNGEETDSTDGQHHLGSVMACCSMILRQMELKTLKDDRFKGENENASDKK